MIAMICWPIDDFQPDPGNPARREQLRDPAEPGEDRFAV